MTKFCMSVDIHDIITCATFCDDRLRGLGVASGRISRFPIDLRRRPYNTLALPCECVIWRIKYYYYYILNALDLELWHTNLEYIEQTATSKFCRLR